MLGSKIDKLENKIDAAIADFNSRFVMPSINQNGGTLHKQAFWKLKKVLAPKSISIPHSIIDSFGNEITDQGNIRNEYKNEFTHRLRNFSSEVEDIFLDMLLPKTKPILIGILYRPPDQSKFLDKLSTAISETDNFDAQEVYILGDLNINLINNQKHTPNGIKRYKEFCSLNGLKQLLF